MSRRQRFALVTAVLLAVAALGAVAVRDHSGDSRPEGHRSGSNQSDDIAPSPLPPRSKEDAVCRRFRAPLTLRVLSFNTHRSTGSLASVAQEIRDLQPDIAILQEVDRRMIRTGGVDQARRLAREVGMTGSFSPNITRGSGQYGTLILSRFAVLNEGRLPLAHAPRAEPRGLQWVVIDVDGQPVRVYNTHLESVRPRLRLQQARQVARTVRRDELPLVLGGDLNSWPGSKPIRVVSRALEDTWAAAGEGRAATSPGGHKIDYLFVKSMRPLRSQVASSLVSDHHRLWAEVRLAAPRRCRNRP